MPVELLGGESGSTSMLACAAWLLAASPMPRPRATSSPCSSTCGNAAEPGSSQPHTGSLTAFPLADTPVKMSCTCTIARAKTSNVFQVSLHTYLTHVMKRTLCYQVEYPIVEAIYSISISDKQGYPPSMSGHTMQHHVGQLDF